MDALAFRGHERKLRRRRVLHIQLSNSVRLAALASVAFRQKNIGPCSLAGRGDSPDFRLLPSPSNRGGWRADKAHCPDYSGRGVRLAPDDGVHFWCPPRLAARQRGILAFMPLTVVGPGRLLVADEAARVRPGDKGCVKSFARRCRSRSPLARRLMKAPLEDGRDGRSIITLQVKSSAISRKG